MGVQMISILPRGSCPRCGHTKFAILECHYTGYLTDNDGYLDKYKEYGSKYLGVCLECGTGYEMVEAYNKLIPLTPLRKKCRDYEPDKLSMTNNVELKIRPKIRNPMEIDNKNV